MTGVNQGRTKRCARCGTELVPDPAPFYYPLYERVRPLVHAGYDVYPSGDIKYLRCPVDPRVLLIGQNNHRDWVYDSLMDLIEDLNTPLQ